MAVGEESPGISMWRLRVAALGCATACLSGYAITAGTAMTTSGLPGRAGDGPIVMGPGIRAAAAVATVAVPDVFTAAAGSPIPAQRSGAAARVMPGVVRIVSKLATQNGSAAGTGMLLNSGGEILTNNHVIQDSAGITVTVASTGRAYPAAVVGADPTDDVAVLQLRGVSGLTAVPIGDSAKVSIGDSVVAVGNAEGGAPITASGAITALNQSITATEPGGGNAEQLTGLIRTNVAIKPGFSGGPLVSAAGQVIGMDTAATMFNEYLPAGMRAGYSIPINHAMSVARQLASAASAGNTGGHDSRAAAASATSSASPASQVAMITVSHASAAGFGGSGAQGRRNGPVAPVAPVAAIGAEADRRSRQPRRRLFA
ncbi:MULTISPECIES: S1C family serine protease [unclassified Frankia]|uniref:S1C family serine protease n=1 Tax=unclassified Frankia TaxID=2632575 RepID=UPI001EF4BF51|nr:MULTISPECIES: trypsin-like peptidase domain-containing protein [unclassified Frankia]